MVRRASMGLCLAIVLLGSCTDRGAPVLAAPSTPASDAMDNKMQLNGSARASSGHLEIQLDWTNSTDQSMWMAVALPRQAGSSVKMDPTAADVDVDDEQRIVVSRRLYPMPEGALMESPEVPEWRLLAPGERYTGRMIVGWPLTRRVPYDRSSPGAAGARSGSVGALGTPQKIRCVVGILPASSTEPSNYRPVLVKQQTLLIADLDVEQALSE
ncbi:MAG: hypothetical protein AAF449_02925 [Myxococcota bacterium]